MSFDWKSAAVGVCGCALLLLALDGVRAEAQRPSSYGASGGGGDANRDLIAVTGTYGSGASVLYLIDTRTKHLAVYRTDNGRKLELVAARNVEFDLKLENLNDENPPGFSPEDLRRVYLRSRGGGVSSRPADLGETAPAAPAGGR